MGIESIGCKLYFGSKSTVGEFPLHLKKNASKNYSLINDNFTLFSLRTTLLRGEPGNCHGIVVAGCKL